MKIQPLKFLAACAVSSCLSVSAFAGTENFHKGTVIPNFGEVATVEADMAIPKRAKFKVLRMRRRA